MQLTKEFLTAGKAIFTVESPSGDYYTYKVSAPGKDPESPVRFVSLLTGPDNESSYTYLGMLSQNGTGVRLTPRSRFSPQAQPVRVVDWAVKHIMNDIPFPPNYRVHHEGRCGKCGRTLTTPESIERGFGPECWEKLQ